MTATQTIAEPVANGKAGRRPSRAREPRRRDLVASLAGPAILGEVVCWKAAGPHAHPAVVQALKDSGLDDSVARERLPRHAFARACKRLSEERVIDLLRDENTSITFQFTRKTLDSGEWRYATETLLSLDKITGKVTCPVPELEAFAQAELDRCMVERTAADVTYIVQRLFERNADLVPLRDQGGVYFVLAVHLPFADRVQGFLGRLGGRMNRLPVPEGTRNGDAAVQASLADYLEGLVAEHERAVDALSASSREDTVKAAAERIVSARVKIEAYASHLAERRDGLLASIEEANRRLLAKVGAIAEERRQGAMEDPCRCRQCGSAYDAAADSLDADYAGYCSAACERAKAVTLGVPDGEPTYPALKAAGEVGRIPLREARVGGESEAVDD